MPNWYRAICLKEIYWSGKTYRQGDTINIIEDDTRTLQTANAIGDIRKISIADDKIEFAITESPENAKQPYKRRGRPAREVIR